MARFYGTLQGNRGEVTRVGSPKSGVTAYIAGWKGAVRSVIYDKEGEDWCRVELTTWQGQGTYRLLYEGPVNLDKD